MKKMLLVFFLMCTFMLVGCTEENNVEDDIHERLTAVVHAQAGIDDLQKEINGHASKEQNLYDEMINLSINEQGSLEQLVADVEIELNESEEKIKQIQEKLVDSEGYMKELEQFTEDLNSNEKQEAFNQLQTKMKNRFQYLNTYYDTYLTSIENSFTLYELFLTEGFQTNNVYDKIEQVNDMYDELLTLNEEINVSTTEVNEAQAEFYELINN